jgi:predicted RNase H-like HicB family nuclease
MPNKTPGKMSVLDLIPLFNLRVLLRVDEKYGVHVAHCIETGNVVTADSEEEARTMIKELLEDEISFALTHRNLKNLFSSPAPLEVLVEWMNAAQESKDTVELDIDLKEAESLKIEPQNAPLKNKVEFAKAA